MKIFMMIFAVATVGMVVACNPSPNPYQFAPPNQNSDGNGGTPGN